MNIPSALKATIKWASRAEIIRLLLQYRLQSQKFQQELKRNESEEAALRALRKHFRPLDVVNCNWKGRPHDIAVYFTNEQWAHIGLALKIIMEPRDETPDRSHSNRRSRTKRR